VDTKTVEMRVKEMVFTEAKKALDAADTTIQSADSVAKAA
jgi:hypothetical protein